MEILYLTPFITAYCLTLTAIIGAVLGSFLNCAAWRIAHNERVSKGRSHCPKCEHTLGPMELIPVVSWLFQKGRCKSCGEKISIRYPLTELFLAAMFVTAVLRFGVSVLLVRNLIYGCCLFTLSLVDWEIYEIPDRFHLISIAAFVLYLPLAEKPVFRLIWGFGGGIAVAAGMLMISLVMDKILKKESLGGGDIKLVFVSGLYLGSLGNLFMLILACILGLMMVAIRKNSRIPFGPALSLAIWIFLLFGEGFVNWYLGLLCI